MSDFVFNVVWRFALRTFAPRPIFSKENDILVARSSWRTSVLTLGARSRKVTIDPNKKVLRITDRRFWFFRTSRRIEFDWVAEILMDDRSMSGNSSWYSYTEEDLIMIGLRLKDGSTITLFRYWQQGSFVNNSLWPDWMKWDEFAAVAAVPESQMDQEASQLGYVLSGLIGVPFT